MEIHILLAGERIGPFSVAQVRQYLEDGLVSPSDLAFHEGLEAWQPLDLLMANLPASEPVPESPADASEVPEQEPPATIPNDASPTVESATASPEADRILPITTSQKTKRKLSKIVIQPILPLETTADARKKARTGHAALKMEVLRPTTSLPSLTGPLTTGKKSGKPSLHTGQLSLGGFFPENPVAAAPKPTPPALPVTPPPLPPETQALPPPMPPETATKIPTAKARSRRIPPIGTFAGVGLAFLLVCSILSYFYFTSAHRETPAEAALINPENSPFSPNPVEAQSPPAVPKTAADYSARGFARQGQGDLDGAIADYNQALALDPKDVQASYRRGVAREAKGDRNGAIADYTAVLRLDPGNADAFSSLGLIKQAQGDMDGALADYNQALVINPKLPVAYYNVGLIKTQKGDLDGAIAAYDHALELDPKMALAYYNRGNTKNTEGNVDGAIADYTQALALNPTAMAYSNRGFARQSRGDADGALADYAQAIALDPKMAVAYYNRSLVKVQKGDLDGAIDDSTQAIALEPKNAQAYCNRGLARLGKNTLEGALADLKKFCEIAPRDSGVDSARLYIWVISTEVNPKGTADQDLTASLQNDWNSSPEDLISKIGAFLVGHINEGVLIANAASPDPSREPGQYCKVWYFAGMKRLLAGDTATAITDFQKSLATNQKDSCDYLFAQAEMQSLGQSHEATPQAATNP